MEITPALKADLRRIVWDYALSEDGLIDIFLGKTKTFSLNRDKLYSRLLISTPWYRLLDHLGVSGLREILTDEAIRLIWIRDVREKFLYARDALRNLA